MMQTVVITDTSVLINFLVLDRAELLSRLSTHRFLVTDHVRAEITDHYHEQVHRLEQAFRDGVVQEITVNDLAELQTFANLTTLGLGSGECSAIAVAAHRGFVLAIDDRQAIKRVASLSYSIQVLTTVDLVMLLIQHQVLSVDDADSMKADWEQNHRFRLKFTSFRDLLSE